MSTVPSAPAPLARADLRTLLTLAWPVILARSTQSVIGLCDAAMTAPLGEKALAAATTGAINTFALIILPMGTAFIVQSFSSQLTGRGDHVAARRYAWYGLLLAALSGAIALAAGPLVGPALGLFRYEPEVHRLQSDYIRLRLLSVGGVVGTEALGNWFAGRGNTRLHMNAGIVAMVANVALNWVFIYGNLGAPAMGVSGAAIASAISSWLGFAVIAVAFGRTLRTPGQRTALGLRFDEFWRTLRFGLPNGFNWFMEFSAWVLFMNAVVAKLGTGVLAAMNVVLAINSVSFMPAFGLASAGAVLVGQAIGRGAKDEVGGIVRRTALVTLAWQVGVGLVYIAVPGLLIAGFVPPGGSSVELREVGVLMLAISGGWQAFDALGLTVGEALRAAGDTTWCMLARLAVAWFVFTPLAFVSVTAMGGGPIAAMVSVVVYLACLAAAFVWRFRGGAWRNIDLTGSEVPMG